MTGEKEVKVETKEGEVLAVKPSYLEEVRKERAEMEKIRDETKRTLEEIKTIRAEDILSGKAPVQKVEVKEEDPKEYLTKITGRKFK